MPKSKVSALFSVLIVFASGIAMGAVGYRLYVVKSITSPAQAAGKKKMTAEDFRKMAAAKLKEAVKLTDQQVLELQKVYDWQGEQFNPIHKQFQAKVDQVCRDYDQQRDQLHDQAVAKTKAILTPEQLPLYEKYAAEREAERKKHQQEHPGQRRDGCRPPA